MARVDDIITGARDTLAEKTPKRWKNDRLLRALSKGQRKIARELLCIRESCTIQLCDGHHTYKLDATNVLSPTGRPIALYSAINHAGKQARFVTENIIEDEDPDWRTRTGDDVTHIIYDKQNPLFFRVYPTPDSTELSETGTSFNTTDNPLTDAATICEAISSPSDFDITAELAPVKIHLHFYHTPPNVVTIADTNLLIPEEFDDALRHYITGNVLRDDLDAQNRQFGMEELQFFANEFEFAAQFTSDDFIDQTDEHHAGVRYNAVIREDQ